MTVKFKCSDGIVRDFLLDTGAAASLVRHALFGKVCSKMGLRPSMLRLSAASGKYMKSRGNAVLHLRLPEQSMQDPPMISHAFEVMEDGAMPAGLQITGVDFWDQLKPTIVWDQRTVECTVHGQKVVIPFSIGDERKVQMAAAVQSVLREDEMQIELTEDLHLLPRQAARVTVAVDKKMMGEEKQVIWAIQAKSLVAPSVDDRSIKVVLQGLSHQQQKMLLKNPLRKETISIPAGTIIGTASSHESVTHALKHSRLFEEDDHEAAGLVKEAKECERRGELQPEEQMSNEQAEEETTSRWMWRPMRMAAAAAVLLIWIAYSCGIAFSDSNRQIVGSIQATEDWRTSLSKTRQQIATLPKDHPLRASEDQLRDRTKEFCEQGGQESYDKWKQQTASTFKYKEIGTEEREKYNQLLFQFRTLFDANPKAPRPVKGVECALYLNDPNVQPRARPVPRLSAAEWKHMEKETDTMLQNGIIRFSSSDWAAVPVFAKKKDGTRVKRNNLKIIFDDFL